VFRVSHRDSALRVKFSAARSNATSAQIAALAPIGPWIVDLNLSQWQPASESLRLLPEMPNLRTLNLSRTPLAGSDLTHLARYPGIQTLNLYGTGVDDTALAHLEALPNLKKVYLFETRVTPQAARQLAESRPMLDINIGWEPLPVSHRTEEPIDARRNSADGDLITSHLP
jgi:hypothetical protein